MTTSEAWIATALITVFVAALVAASIALRKYRQIAHTQRVVIESFGKPLLFYDHRQRLLFYTTGLILFDRQAIRKLSRPPVFPEVGQEAIGELEIDFNLYRYRASRVQYLPELYGLLVVLDYQRSVQAKH